MEDKDIEIIEQYITSSFRITLPENVLFSLEKLLKAYKQDEKVIEEMAKTIYEDDGSWNMYNKYNVKEIIAYFRKECE